MGDTANSLAIAHIPVLPVQSDWARTVAQTQKSVREDKERPFVFVKAFPGGGCLAFISLLHLLLSFTPKHLKLIHDHFLLPGKIDIPEI